MEGACVELAGKVPAQPVGRSEVEELTLIRRAQEGDRASFDVLVRLYDQQVLRLAVQVVHSPEEARDLYQEAFLKVYRSLHRFRLDARFSTWLYRVVMNVCLDHLRRQKVRKARVRRIARAGAGLHHRSTGGAISRSGCFAWTSSRTHRAESLLLCGALCSCGQG